MISIPGLITGIVICVVFVAVVVFHNVLKR